MPRIRPGPAKKKKSAPAGRGSLCKPGPKLKAKLKAKAHAALAIGEVVRKRAETEAAVAQARRSHERLREAIDIIPEGIVFLDPEGRYILWNRKYAEIYSRSADLFEPGARLQDTLRIGFARGDYP